MSERAVRILYLEDVARDAELVQAMLAAEGIDSDVTRVDRREDFTSALEAGDFDLVLSDYSIPGFDGGSALRIVRERRPELPFVFVSGTLGEETAVGMVQSGATDYVLKERLTRLVPAVRRALREAEERTTRRRAEERIREQAAFLDRASDAIAVRDLDGRVRYWNHGAERLYGWSAAEVEARGLPYDPAPESVADAWQQLLDKGEWSGEIERRTRDGRTVVVVSRWSLVEDAQGGPRSVLVIDTDVTEIRRLEAQFYRAQRMENIGALAGGIAHDLNNILLPVLMTVELLRALPAADRSDTLLANIEASARRGADLVKQILMFARGMEPPRAPLPAASLLAELETMVREALPSRIEVRIERVGDVGCVEGDRTQLIQVLLNLCVNARDAMPDGGVLTVRAESIDVEAGSRWPQLRPGPYLLLRVTDTGCGIPAEIQGRIFEPFFTTKEEGKGTGLGLSTSLAIVRKHRGALDLASEPGRGTTFHVVLPAAEAGRSAGIEEAGLAPLGGNGERVLVVDDEKAVREITKEMLELHGYDVLAAGDGNEALLLYQREGRSIDVVLTDMTMPGMDGRATIRALRRIDPSVKVVATSGLEADAFAADSADARATAFLMKPYSRESLLGTLRAVLGVADPGAVPPPQGE